jgi:hypothetical protein
MSAHLTTNGMPFDNTSKPRFAFRDGESFNGGVARFAASNWHERMIEVTSAAGLEFGHRPSASAVGIDRLAALADFMGVDVAELSARARPHHGESTGGGGHRVFNGIILPTALVEGSIRRYAPASLRLPDGDHHRALWDLRLLPACAETGQILLDRCQSTICEGGRVGWVVTSGITHCEHCMADLRDSEGPYIAPDLLAAIQPVAAVFSAAMRHAALACLPTRLALGEGQLAADLLVALMPVVDPTLRNDMQRLHIVDPVRVCEATAQAWNLMEGWPNRFLDLVRNRTEGRGKRHDDGNLGRTSHFLRKLDTSGSPALGAVIAEIRDTLDLDGPAGAGIAARTYRIKDAASVVSVGTQQLAELRRGKALSTVIALRAGRCELLFDRAEIVALKDEISLRMGFDRASSLLGIPHDGVAQLVELRVLELLDHPFHLARYGVHQTTQTSFTQLTADLLAHQSSLPGGEDIRITQAMKAVGGRFKPWGPAFEALLASKIAFTVDDAEGPFVHRIRVAAKNSAFIAALVFTPATPPRLVPSAMMSKDDAADVLNIGSRQANVLFSDVPTKKGCREKTLVVDDVLAMASRSISSSELAARRGVIPQTAYADAVRARIQSHGLAGFCRAGAEAEFGL